MRSQRIKHREELETVAVKAAKIDFFTIEREDFLHSHSPPVHFCYISTDVKQGNIMHCRISHGGGGGSRKRDS